MRGALRRSTAFVALIAFAASFGLPFAAPTHAWIDDPDSGWRGIPVIGTPAQVEAPTSSRDEHCAICHWMRALGSSVVGVKSRRPSLTLSRPGPVATFIRFITTPADAGPARAPPSFIA